MSILALLLTRSLSSLRADGSKQKGDGKGVDDSGMSSGGGKYGADAVAAELLAVVDRSKRCVVTVAADVKHASTITDDSMFAKEINKRLPGPLSALFFLLPASFAGGLEPVISPTR